MDFGVLFVDGGSSDGTLEFLSEQSHLFDWLFVISQERERGLGAAYSQGMLHAIEQLKPDFLLEIDGDRQHRVQDIPLFLEKAKEGYDYVIGSRFIPGGAIPNDWGLERTFLSWVGNFVARTTLSLSVRDVTSGFKLSRVKGFLDSFDFAKLYSKRHSYKVHMLYFMLQKGAKWCEVPIVFEVRRGGESKLIKNDILDMLSVLFRLRLRGS
ncbi:MAG: glycosyltransferase [Bdellovibrionales bacterium]|nr:glycosyltransferase [Bdellovibrionales bacterium]